MADDNLFNFLIYENEQLVYSKYNFDFSAYQSSINDTSVLTPQKKITLFASFLALNGTTIDTFDQPTTLRSGNEIFFTPITLDIQNYVSKYGVFHSVWLNYIDVGYNTTFFEENQFDLYPYPDNIRIQDFIHSNANFDYNKFNVNFDQYVSDFSINDNKLVAFTDLIFRNYKMSASLQFSSSSDFNIAGGYIILDLFKKYFNLPVTQSLIDYMTTYSVSTHNNLSSRRLDTIDFTQYLIDNPDVNINGREHFIRYGQFEERILKFIVIPKIPIENARLCAGTIFLKTKIDTPLCTCFLYQNSYFDSGSVTTINIYIVSTYHIIALYPD